MRRTLLILIALFTATTTTAAVKSYVSVMTLAPLSTLSVDGEATVIDSVLGDGQLIDTKAVDDDRLRAAGFAGSIINAIVYVPDAREVEALIIDGEPTGFATALSIPTYGATPLLLETPKGLTVASVDSPLNIGHGGYDVAVIEYPLTTFDVVGVISDNDAHVAQILDLSDHAHRGFAGSIVSIHADQPLQIEAVGSEGTAFSVRPRKQLPNPEGTYVALLSPDSLVIAEVDR